MTRYPLVLLCLVAAVIIATANARPRKENSAGNEVVICPYEGQVYEACSHTFRLCNLTCRNKDDPPKCPTLDECVPGCVCPEGEVLHKKGINKGKCVAPDECPKKAEAKKKPAAKKAPAKKAGK